MDYDRLISKIAADRDSKELGKIIRIENLMGKTIKTKKPYAMILVRKFLKSDTVVPLSADKVTKIEGQYAWFDISKEEFSLEAKRVANITTEREIYSGEIVEQSSSNRFWTGIDYTNLSKGRKERKR